MTLQYKRYCYRSGQRTCRARPQLSRVRPICLLGFLSFYVIAGQERPTDQEMGDGKGLDLARRSSVTSMESTVSSGTQTAVQDDPEQFEVIKQQKEMIEHGIEL